MFIILVGRTMTWFSEKMLTSNRCIDILLPNLIKKSWTVSMAHASCHKNSWCYSESGDPSNSKNHSGLKSFLTQYFSFTYKYLHVNLFLFRFYTTIAIWQSENQIKSKYNMKYRKNGIATLRKFSTQSSFH